ncbi:MAG: S8 family serine peptidase [Isosphaeraceae bacterium]
MPLVKFGKKDEPGFELVESDDMIAVRTRSRRSIRREGTVLTPFAAEVRDGSLVAAFPAAGVEIYRVPPERRSLALRKEALRASPDVRFAGGVLVDPGVNEPVLYTENLFIKFRDDADPDDCLAVLREAGLQVKSTPSYAANAYFAAAPEGVGTRVFQIAQDLLARADVEYCHPELIRPREPKGIFPQQWHLQTGTVGGVLVNASANVASAHELTRGEGITVAVIDDGVDIDHPEFAGPGKVVAPRDATRNSDDPRPKDDNPLSPDDHGTACSGVAVGNGALGASGVAPKARLMPIRLASGLGSIEESNAFHWAADHGADVISCSWGPTDGRWFDPTDPRHNRRVELPASTRLAIEYAVANGRGGKGCVILFAAGNGNESVENDGYASFEKVIAVAACNDRGKRSVYSDFGEAVWCAFPSNDIAFAPLNVPAPLTPGIWTTDRVGPLGYNPGSPQFGDDAGLFANDFGGTSSACPGAAGVAALALAVNPELKWHEVKDVLKRCCDGIDPQGGQYDARGHSPLYGFGRLNARAAAELAKPQPRSKVTVSRTFNTPIPDRQSVTVTLDVAESVPIADVFVNLDIKHTFIGDLVITLTPPPATGAGHLRLHDRAGGATKDLKKTYDAAMIPKLASLRGKSSKGTWTLQVRDAAAQDEGTLIAFGLELTLQPPAPDPEPRPRSRGATTRLASTRAPRTATKRDGKAKKT